MSSSPFAFSSEASSPDENAASESSVSAMRVLPAALKTRVTSEGATGAQVIDRVLTEQARESAPGTVAQLGKDLLACLDPDRAPRLDADAVARRSGAYTRDLFGMGVFRFVLDPATTAGIAAAASTAGPILDTTPEDLPETTLARLACDSPLRRVVTSPTGAVLDLGRATRYATAVQRRPPRPPVGRRWHHRPQHLHLLCGRHHTAVHAGVRPIRMIGQTVWVKPPPWIDPHRRLLRNTTHHTRLRARRVAQQLRLDLGPPPHPSHSPTRLSRDARR